MAQHVRDLLAMVPSTWSVEDPVAPLTAALRLRAYLSSRSMSSSDAGTISDTASDLERIAAALMDQADAAQRDRQPPEQPVQDSQRASASASATTFPSACTTASAAAGAAEVFTRTGDHITMEESDGTTSLWSRRTTYNVPTPPASVDNFPAVGQDIFHNPLPDDPDPRALGPRATKRGAPDEHCNLVRVVEGPARVRRRPEYIDHCAICPAQDLTRAMCPAQDHTSSLCPLLPRARRAAANTSIQFDFSAADHLDAALSASDQAIEYRVGAARYGYRSTHWDLFNRYKKSLHATAVAHTKISKSLSTLESEAQRRLTYDACKTRRGRPFLRVNGEPAADIKHVGPCPCDDEACPCGVQHPRTGHDDGHDSSPSSDDEDIDDEIDRASVAPVGNDFDGKDIATGTTLAPQEPGNFSGITVVINPGMMHPSPLGMERALGSPTPLADYDDNMTAFTNTTMIGFMDCFSDISDSIGNLPISSSTLALARISNPHLNAHNLEQLGGPAAEPAYKALGAPPGLSALGAPLPPSAGGELAQIPAPANSVTYSDIFGHSSLARLLESPHLPPSYSPAPTPSVTGGDQLEASISTAPIAFWEPFRSATPHPSSPRTHPCITCKRRYVTAYATQVYDVFEAACAQAASCNSSDRCGTLHDKELDPDDLDKEFEDLFMAFGYYGAYLIN
jgi:hypothetical protein